MESRRLVRVAAGGSMVSGCVIAESLVLTCAHGLPDAGGSVDVTGSDDRPRVGSVMWRGTPGGTDDVALVRSEGIGAGLPGLAFGRLVTEIPDTPCFAWGYPHAAHGPEGPDTAQISGRVSAGDRMHSDVYVLRVDGTPPTHPPGDSRTPWRGLSGAPLVASGRVAGVLRQVDPGWRDSGLQAVPAYVLLDDSGARAVLVDAGVRTVADPVEFVDLTEGPPRPPDAPVALLRPDCEAVRFRGRADLLDDLAAWCESPERLALRLLHAPGGQGKSRLALELAHRMEGPERRWAVARLRADADPGAAAVLASCAVPLLVVADYAEIRLAQMAALVKACAERSSTRPLRLLLLARTAGAWWDRLGRSSEAAGDLVDRAPVEVLPPVDTVPAEQRNAYRDAVADLRPAVARLLDLPERELADAGSDLPRRHRPSGQQIPILDIQMTALADLLDGAGPGRAGDRPRTGKTSAEARLIRHEERYWANSARVADISLSEVTCERAVVAALLTGAADRDESLAVLSRVRGVHDSGTDTIDRVDAWIAGLYPAAPGARWGSLQPDRLGEFAVARWLGDRDGRELVPALIPGLGPQQARHLITMLTRATAAPVHGERVRDELGALISGHPEKLAAGAVETALQVPPEEAQILVRALRTVVASSDTPADVLEAVHQALPGQLAAELGELALAVARTRVQRDEPGAAGTAVSVRMRYDLANRLYGPQEPVDAGQLAEAEREARRCVEMAVVLAENDLWRMGGMLADAERLHADILYALGRDGEAETVMEASRAHVRDRAEWPSEIMNAIVDAVVSRVKDADELIVEEAARDVAEVVHDAFRRSGGPNAWDIVQRQVAADVAEAHHLLARGLQTEALARAENAVRVAEHAFEQSPHHFWTLAAWALGHLSDVHVVGQNWKAADEPTRRCVELLGGHRDELRAEGLRNLAGDLVKRALVLARLQRHAEVGPLVDDARSIADRLASESPGRFGAIAEGLRSAADTVERGSDRDGRGRAVLRAVRSPINPLG